MRGDPYGDLCRKEEKVQLGAKIVGGWGWLEGAGIGSVAFGWPPGGGVCEWWNILRKICEIFLWMLLLVLSSSMWKRGARWEASGARGARSRSGTQSEAARERAQ